MARKRTDWKGRIVFLLVSSVVLALGHFYPDHHDTYHREDWPHWVKNNGSCQNTRTKILITRSEAPVRYKSKTKCQVGAGKWLDAYTGRWLFQAQHVEVDHVIPLYYAHQHGGQDWPRAKKEAFANDLENLKITSHVPNTDKSAKGPTAWRPPVKEAWCDYGQRWQKISARYQLALDWQDQQAVKRLLAQCDK